MSVVRLNTSLPKCQECGIPLLPVYRAETDPSLCAQCEMFGEVREVMERAARRADERSGRGAHRP